jgi:putative solute:sodium symporter small subunit
MPMNEHRGIEDGHPGGDADQRRYWRKNLNVSGILLGVWFVVTFVIGYFARDLNFSFFGWPFSFWVAAQGAVIVYVALICYYARYMNRLDRQQGASQRPPAPPQDDR